MTVRARSDDMTLAQVNEITDDQITDIETAKTKASEAKETAEAEVTNRTTLVREYNDGVLVCKTGNNIGALVNADGSFDVVSVTWSDGTPTVGDTLSTFGADSLQIGQSGSANIVLSSSAFEMYATNGGRIISIDPTGGSGNMAFRDSIGGNETKALSTTPVSGSTITVRLSRGFKAGKSSVSLFGSATFTYGTAATKTITDSDTASSTGTTYTMNVTVTYDGSTTITTTTNSGVTPSGYITYTALGQVPGMTVSGSIDAANINGYDITAEDKVSAPAVQATQVLYGEAGSITTDLDVGGDITAGGHSSEIGDYQSQSGTSVSLAAATWKNITSISLPAGSWVVMGTVNFGDLSSASTGGMYASLTITSGVSSGPTEVSGRYYSTKNGIDLNTCVPFSLSSTTTIYLTAYSTHARSGNNGYIRAVRIA